MKIMMELVIVLIVLILIIIFLLYKIASNKLNIINIKIEKSETKLKESLDKKFELILKVINFLNDKPNFNEDDFHDTLNINLKKIVLVDLNNNLIDCDKKIEKYLLQNEKLVNNKELIEINKELNELNITINVTRKYYNSAIKEYNQAREKFPTNIVGKIKNYQEKEKLKENQREKLKILS